jgi:hypothetical protein
VTNDEVPQKKKVVEEKKVKIEKGIRQIPDILFVLYYM